MVQPLLFERAKSGDPVAIEGLMNLALESRGVTAKTYRRGNCLYVCLTATQLLNRAPLIQFIQQGFANLGTTSIQTVKLVALKQGQDLPVWTEEITLDPTGRSAVEQGQSAATPSGWKQVSPIREAGYWKPLRQSAQLFWQQAQQVMPRSPWTLGRSVRLAGFPSPYLTSSSLLILAAFLSGGVAAVVVNSQTLHSGPTESAGQSDLATSQMAIRTNQTFDLAQQQQSARGYLEKMTQTQRSFYQQQNRLATSLEELERSANLISQSVAYTYQLSMQNETQTQLTATPKVAGLKSYRAIVAMSPVAEGQSAMLVVGICESNSAAQVPPTEPQVVDGQVECGVDATRLP